MSSPEPVARIEWGVVVHGGAGTISRARMTPEIEAQYRRTVAQALEVGRDALAAGGTAVDAVERAVVVLEDSPLFNAGHGAAFAHDGTNSLDAALMDGDTLRAGSVAGVRHVKNPITLARAVMEQCEHVMLAGDGAEEFAREHGIELVPTSYFRTEWRWRQLQEALRREAEGAGSSPLDVPAPDLSDAGHGTVGAVALDRDGRIAAATSTGGVCNKRWGRIGDSPLIGCGTYAGARCGVSATGAGEYFIRNVVAHDVCARMTYAGVPLAQAADDVVNRVLVAQRGAGGVIAIDAGGHVAWPFNSPGMYRGWIGPTGPATVRIYQQEEDGPGPSE